MESQEPRETQPYLRPEEDIDRYTRIRNIDPDAATDDQVDDDELDDE